MKKAPIGAALGAALGAAAAGAGLILLLRVMEDHLIFWPTRNLRTSPSHRDLPFEEIALEPVPGVTIRGWFLPHSQPRAAVLYLQGNGGNRSLRLGHLEMLHHLGCSSLIVDYEGYGDSDGRPSEAAVHRDARVARGWLSRHPLTRDLPLVLFGESLGGAVAIKLARENPPHGLIVDHSFTRMPEMIDRVCRGVPVSRICRSDYDSVQNITQVRAPVLVLHGDADRFIPIEHGQRLFEAAREPKRFVPIPGAPHDHNAVLRIGGDVYRDAIDRFLEDVTARPCPRC